MGEAKKGIPKTQEHRNKIRLTLLGRKNPAHAERMRGRKQSLETKRKRSVTLKRIGAGLWNRGRTLSEEQKKKISQAVKGKNLGRKFTKEHRKKLSERKKLLLSDPTRHPQWRGGITTYQRKLYLNLKRRSLKLGAQGTHTQSEWEALKRDCTYQCMKCKRKEPLIILTEDHIVPLTKGGNDSITNIQPLCRGCNSRKHTSIIKYDLAVK
tara:strand:- start:45 stop:674 length:630 start_codon:yes stop_codon:yes gene_type:complete